jgi:hypothetical protein
MGDLQKRLQQIYAAVEDAAAVTLQAPQWVSKPVIIDGRQVGITGSWDIEMTEARLTNVAYSAIDTISVFCNSMLFYGKSHGIPEDQINQVTEYKPLKLIRDLHNSRKHPEMKASGSGKSLELRELRRGLKSGPKPIEIDFTPWGKNDGLIDTGGAVLTIEGDIVETNTGKGIASLGETIAQGVAKWEEFLHRCNLI